MKNRIKIITAIVFAIALILGPALFAIHADKPGAAFKDSTPIVETKGAVADNLGEELAANVAEEIAAKDADNQADLVTDAILEAVAPSSPHCIVATLESGESLQFVIPSINAVTNQVDADTFRDAIRERIREALKLGAVSFDLYDIGSNPGISG